MEKGLKNREEILNKMGITGLNQMQETALREIEKNANLVVLSPTGSGKTLAFLLPIIESLNPNITGVQALVVAPSRELAIQIEQVMRSMGSGYKVNAVYGGRSSSTDRVEIKTLPAVLIGTPGRLSDHLQTGTVDPSTIKFVVLDEFDKSLEIGYAQEMEEVFEVLNNLEHRILTSATQKVKIPEYLKMESAKTLDFLNTDKPSIEILEVHSPEFGREETLFELISEMEGSGIVFCNYNETIQRVHDMFNTNGVEHSCFYGGLEQIDREKNLVKFRNGTSKVLLATDLAARGLDIPALDFIIHFQTPPRPDEFIHRNGRTARMNAHGKCFVITGKGASVPSFIKFDGEHNIKTGVEYTPTLWSTLYLTGGRKDKISKGDIVGFFTKQGGLIADEIGHIELKTKSAYIAVPKTKLNQLIHTLNNTKLKTKKVRLSVLD